MAVLRWRSQNLKEDSPVKALLHGRGWLSVGRFRERDDRAGQRSIDVEWYLGPWRGLRLMFTRAAEEHDYEISISFLFASLYLSLSNWRAYGAMERCGWGRSTGAYYVDDHLVLKWDCDDSHVSYRNGRATPRLGWTRSWFVRDVLLGAAKHSSAPLGSPVPRQIVMPEGTYPCTVQLTEDTWTRPRWPWPLRIRRAYIEIPGGVPIPGKGENSWDCGEDATYGSTAPADSVLEALQHFEASTLKTRLKRGGRDWRPAPKAAR